MTNHAPDPLTPEERELAARLARIGPHGEPSPALDARILGAAQTAAARKPARDPRRRWPAWAGIAATLVLALGAVWQLRPVQEFPVVLDEAPKSISPPKPPAAPARTSSAPAEVPAAKAIASAKRTPAAAKPLPAPPVVFDDPSPVDVPAPVVAPPPPPAPPAPPAPAPTRSVRPTASAAARTPPVSPAAPMSVLAESAANDTQAFDADTNATLTVTDLPVESDRQLPPVDWIERIRQRHDAGDLASARASLALLQHDYPRLSLPDDVRAIAAPSRDR